MNTFWLIQTYSDAGEGSMFDWGDWSGHCVSIYIWDRARKKERRQQEQEGVQTTDAITQITSFSPLLPPTGFRPYGQSQSSAGDHWGNVSHIILQYTLNLSRFWLCEMSTWILNPLDFWARRCPTTLCTKKTEELLTAGKSKTYSGWWLEEFQERLIKQ